jgi:hypothetical protein
MLIFPIGRETHYVAALVSILRCWFALEGAEQVGKMLRDAKPVSFEALAFTIIFIIAVQQKA